MSEHKLTTVEQIIEHLHAQNKALQDMQFEASRIVSATRREIEVNNTIINSIGSIFDEAVATAIEDHVERVE